MGDAQNIGAKRSEKLAASAWHPISEIHMRLFRALLFACLLIGVSGCSRREVPYDRPIEARGSEGDADTAARKAGRAAYKASQEAGKLAKEAGHEIKVKSQEMREGWKDAKREAREQKK